MKEYIADTGGRYTYADDILNLQELALSMTAIFSECSDFVISGCEISGIEITPGYVWLGGKVRYFEGCTDAAFPYFIYEKNSNESVVYANEVNKRGRTNYLCVGGVAVPETIDAVTGVVPRFIEIKSSYAPRFIDKFFGRYALLLDTPFAKQTVKKDLIIAGALTVEKDIESKTALSVANLQNGYVLKNIVKATGEGSIGAYLNGLLVNEIVINTDGSFSFIKQGRELARVTAQGIVTQTSVSEIACAGSVCIYDTHIINTATDSDDGAVNINFTGYSQGVTRYRDLNVYGGKKGVPLLKVEGKTGTSYVNGLLSVCSNGLGISLTNTAYLKSDKKLTNLISWRDSAGESIGYIGYPTADTFDFMLCNRLGSIIVVPQGYIDIQCELRIGGTPIGSIYTTQTAFTTELAKKVDKITGKQLSTEDFTTVYKQKLDSISGSTLESGGNGFVTAKDITEALKMKLGADENLRDVMDKAAARTNIDVYSKGEGNSRYLQISNKLLELVNLTADEINNLTHEQANALKAAKQQAVRDNIDAEKAGTGEMKLAKASNLADLTDKALSRKNISVYSVAEIDAMMSGKLSSDGAYSGVIFTETMKQKLDGIKTGNFAYIDNQGVSHTQTEGYVLTSAVLTELAKKANLLMDGLNSAQKDAVAANLGIYTKTVADGKFASVEQLFQDYITYLVKGGKTTTEAQKTLRDKLDVLSKADVSGTYLTKAGQLSDLTMPNADAKKLACRNIGAAYADDYQTKLIDTGWIQMNNSGLNTDTRSLFVRQIGNIVSIQGVINTARRDGGNMGGVVAVIPNQIQPPKYGLRCTHADFNDDHKFNRGAWFKIFGGSRNINIYESGYYNVNTEINFTYFI